MSSFPTFPFPASVTPRSLTTNIKNQSRSGKTFSRSFGTHLWELDVQYPPLRRADMDTILAFALARQIDAESFTFDAHDRRVPRGAASGTPLVAGAGQTGASIDLDGFAAGVTNILLPGDLLLINGHSKVYMVSSPADSDGSGQATVSLIPNLIMSYADNAAVTVVNVPFTMTLVDEVQEVKVGQRDLYTYSMKLREAY